MLQQQTAGNIRIKKSFPLDNKYMKSTNGLTQTKYSEPFGKFFIQKNKDRISQVDPYTKSNKYSERYLINPNKLQKLNEKQQPLLNRTLSNPPTNQDFRVTVPMFNQHRTSQSYRSHLLTVNIKQLPKLHPAGSFNASHSRVWTLKQDLVLLQNQAINLTVRTKDMAIVFDRTKKNLQSNCNQIQRNLKSKCAQLQSLLSYTKSEHKQRSQNLNNDSVNVKQKNNQIKNYLHQIQAKIMGIQNALGVTTAHHKHYI